ncbi:MAG: RsmD family RNA methyltransferase, partial [Planctomycetota bacterium]
MRIIAGEFRRRKLISPPDAETTRPIPDRVKGALFNLMRGHIEGASVFDAFAGTGAVALEAVSRGAERVVCIERDRKIASILQRNVDQFDARDRVRLIQTDALGPTAFAACPDPCTIAFFDPPYPLIRERAGWERLKAHAAKILPKLSDDGFLIIRTPWPLTHETESHPVEVEGVEHAPSQTDPEGDEVIELDLDGLSDEEADAVLEAFEAEARAEPDATPANEPA